LDGETRGRAHVGSPITDDAISVSLRDGRVITMPLVWYPRLLDATATQRKNWKLRQRLRNSLARHRRGSEH